MRSPHLHGGLCLAAALAIAACGKPRDDEAAPAPAPPAVVMRGPLHAIAELRGRVVLVEGTRRIALWVGDTGWYEPDARGLAAQPLLGAAIGRARAELGELADVFLGAQPILAGGEEHREQSLRFRPEPLAIAVPGMIVQVVTTGALEVWRYDHELRTELASVDAAGAIRPLAALPRIGPAAEARSPVSAKACAVPKVRDLAAAGDVVLALVTECHPDAPVRIATYRWPRAGAPPEVAVAVLGTLELQVDRLLATRTGAPILVGRRGDTLAIVRPGGAVALGPRGVESVTHATVAEDGAVWTRTIGRAAGGRDRIAIHRDAAPIALASPAGAELRAESLAYDERLGIVVLARDGATAWLLAERPLTGQPGAGVILLPPR